MKKSIVITVMMFLLTASGAGLSYARQAGWGYGQGSAWNCPYRSTAVTPRPQQSQNGWYCPRTEAWTTGRNHYGPMYDGSRRGHNRNNRNQNWSNR